MQTLKRDIGIFGATMMGLGSILGTGIFVSVGIAAGVAGPAVLLAIVLAALVAVCNALSSAQLAASAPVSGGTYEYGYLYLNPRLGFLAGWMFLCAKSASAATAALGFAGYLLYSLGASSSFLTPLAAGTAIVLTLLVLSGLRRSSMVNSVIVSLTILSLVVFVIAGIPQALENGSTPYTPFFTAGSQGSLPAFLQATALMFVAYTGYGRIATLGEEVRNPESVIPRAIIITLIVSAVLYISVGAIAIGVLGATELGASVDRSAAPLEYVASTYNSSAVTWLISLAAMLAMLGVLLNLLLGLSRVLLAMGRRGDMPKAVARLNTAQTTPTISVLCVGVFVTALSCIGSVKTTWSFSAFTVLVYYAITNLAALRLPQEARLYPRVFAYGGLVSCLFLAAWVEWRIWLAGLGVLALGLLWHSLAHARRAC